jgi:hypothetical protein
MGMLILSHRVIVENWMVEKLMAIDWLLSIW